MSIGKGLVLNERLNFYSFKVGLKKIIIMMASIHLNKDWVTNEYYPKRFHNEGLQFNCQEISRVNYLLEAIENI